MISLGTLCKLFTLVSASFIQPLWFMITTAVPFVVSRLITTWMLNLKDSKILLQVTIFDCGIYC